MKYLLADLKDAISPKSKRRLKKVLGLKTQKSNIIFREGSWVERKSKKYQGLFMRDFGKNIVSNIKKEVPLPVISRQKDYFIEKKLHSGFYTFSDMLVIKNPYGLTPLTALAIFYTTDLCRVKVTVKGDSASEDVSGVTKKGQYHRVPIMGLYADKNNNIILSLLDDKGLEIKKTCFTIKTNPLPVNMQNMVSVMKKTKESAMDLTFVYGGDTLYPYAFDRCGKIRYYLRRTPKAYGLYPLENGKFLFSEKMILKPTYNNPHATNIMEMDLLGRVYKIFNVEKGLHHDACEMPKSGNLLGAASSLKDSNEDSIVEIHRQTGEVVKEIELGNLLDNKYKTSVDWIHINTVSYIAENNTVIACLRNLHSVICIHWNTGELLWLLGNPEFWKGTSIEDKVLKPVEKEMKWFYQAHASYKLDCDLDNNPDTFHIIIFDNHWHKRRPVPYFDESTSSYVKIYTINEKEKTVSLWKEFPSLKSSIRSNGIFMKKQRRVFSMNGYLQPPVENFDGMIYEFDYDTQKVLNQYATVNSFYRAYELWMNYEELSRGMNIKDMNYLVGELEHPVKISKLQLKGCRNLPKKELELPKKEERPRKKMRKEEMSKLYKKNKQNHNVDIKKELGEINFVLREDILYVRAKDHFIEHLYFVGNQNTFMMDFTKTKQHTPSLFGEFIYYIAIPLKNMVEDNYSIYIKCRGVIYKTRKGININTNPC